MELSNTWDFKHWPLKCDLMQLRENTSPGIAGCISLWWWTSVSLLSRMRQCDGFTMPRQLEVL